MSKRKASQEAPPPEALPFLDELRAARLKVVELQVPLEDLSRQLSAIIHRLQSVGK